MVHDFYHGCLLDAAYSSSTTLIVHGRCGPLVRWHIAVLYPNFRSLHATIRDVNF